jgi:hypothetical protein
MQTKDMLRRTHCTTDAVHSEVINLVREQIRLWKAIQGDEHARAESVIARWVKVLNVQARGK